jgi:hydrogenase maturation protease
MIGDRVLVLGVGNPLLEDDGVGLVLLDRLRSRLGRDDEPGRDGAPDDGDPALEFADGGTWGLSLLPLLQDADRVLVLDAVRTGAPPGTVVQARDDAVPRLYTRPVSPHQVDLREVLAAAELLDQLPRELAVVGIEPERTEGLRIGLTPAVAAAVETAVGAAAEVLRAWSAADLVGG